MAEFTGKALDIVTFLMSEKSQDEKWDTITNELLLI